MSKKEKERELLTNPELGFVKQILEKATSKDQIDMTKGNITSISISALKQDRIGLVESLAAMIRKANYESGSSKKN